MATGCELPSEKLRGSGEFAVFRGREYEVHGGNDEEVALWFLGDAPPDEGFKAKRKRPDGKAGLLYIQMVKTSDLDSVSTISTTAWWCGGLFSVERVDSGEALITYKWIHQHDSSDEWLKSRPQLEYDAVMSRLGGFVPVSELYEINQRVT